MMGVVRLLPERKLGIDDGKGQLLRAVFDVDAGVSSAVDIFTLDKNPSSAPSGNGVKFFSGTFGEYTGQKAGYIYVLPTQINYPYYRKAAGDMCFNYQGVSLPEEAEHRCNSKNSICGGGGSNNCSDTGCESFQDCPKSFQVRGNYLIVLYSGCTSNEDCDVYSGYTCVNSTCVGPGGGGSNSGATKNCQTFRADTDNLNVQQITTPEAPKLTDVYIIPLK